MKIVCANCHSAFKVVAVRGDKKAVPDEKRVVVRCPICIDVLALSLHKVPETERERDDQRIRLLDQVLWPAAGARCARGAIPSETLVCSECPVYGAIDKAYCDKAKERWVLLSKTYEDGLDPEVVEDEATSEVAVPRATGPVGDDDFFMSEDD